MPNIENYQPWTAQVVMGAADNGKEIKAAPGADKLISVTKLIVTIITSAAQSMDVEGNGNVNEMIKTPPSPAAGAQFMFSSEIGVDLPVNTALMVAVSGVGIAALIVAEGYIKGKF